MSVQGVAVLGSTGSIGCNTLDVIARHPERYRVVALAAGVNVTQMLAQIRVHRPDVAVMADAQAAKQLAQAVRDEGLTVTVQAGAEAVAALAARSDVHSVMAAISGAAGLPACMVAAQQGKRILLANKEALVLGGEVFLRAVRQGGAQLLPVDSEHSAIFQALPQPSDSTTSHPYDAVARLILTASGGPFLQRERSTLHRVTPQEACAHPNWVMGRKISVDSATMMNKVLEVIEAHYLFGLAPERISVVIHPQSIVHSMVEYHDASIMAQMGAADMRTPIAVALAWPERITSGAQRLDFAQVLQLSFLPPDPLQFAALPLAWQALQGQSGSAAVLNAANEVAVAAFLAQTLPFDAIARVNAYVLQHLRWAVPQTLSDLWALDRQAREFTQQTALGRA